MPFLKKSRNTRRACVTCLIWGCLVTLPEWGSAQINSPDADAVFESQALFESNTAGYHCFRIPSLVTTPDGIILAFCEARRDSCRDHADVDLVMRRSLDGGRTWSNLTVLFNDDEHTIGNPCPVVDQRTGTIWLPFCRNNRSILMTSSEDAGLTWSEPVDITSVAKKKEWHWVGTGPGHGIQVQSGRLLIPSWADETPQLGQRQTSYVFYSDDSGQTWSVGGALTSNQSDECEVVELHDGTVYMNARSRQNQKKRAVAISRDGGLSWSPITFDPLLPEPSCQGAVVRFMHRTPSQTSSLVLVFPRNPNARQNLTAHLSNDEGLTWVLRRPIYAGPAAYSDLTVNADQQILCLFEKDNYSSLSLVRFNLCWITESRENKK